MLEVCCGNVPGYRPDYNVYCPDHFCHPAEQGRGLGGLTGADTGGIFTARRGIEKILFRVTIIVAVLFFVLATVT